MGTEEFRILTYADKPVDQSMLQKGIYMPLRPVLLSKDMTIGKMVEAVQLVSEGGHLVKDFDIKEYLKNLWKCTMKSVYLTTSPPEDLE